MEEVRYTDFNKMMTDIRAYTNATGNQIMCADDPSRLLLGFAGGEKWFLIRLADIAKAKRENGGEHTPLVKRALRTYDGKIELADILNGHKVSTIEK